MKPPLLLSSGTPNLSWLALAYIKGPVTPSPQPESTLHSLGLLWAPFSWYELVAVSVWLQGWQLSDQLATFKHVFEVHSASSAVAATFSSTPQRSLLLGCFYIWAFPNTTPPSCSSPPAMKMFLGLEAAISEIIA